MAPPSGVPPTLAPSVEEAYRRKCIQLKQRVNEVEHDNDSVQLRVTRLERAVQKIRLERSFLLEQLAKRTSTNVEDSDGSPSPPPTPKEKPLRNKRGHRKPSFLNNLDPSAGSSFIQQGPVTLSPSSDAFSHNIHDTARNSTPQAAASKRLLPTINNGLAVGASATHGRKPKSAFDIYCNETRSVILASNAEAVAQGDFDIDQKLAVGWQKLEEERKAEFQKRFEQIKKGANSEKTPVVAPKQAAFDGDSLPASTAPTVDDPDEDVEMGDDKTEPPAPVEGGGGFTAVNRG
ncbi:hypothetical protein HYFRA_00010351 [Hymenoscyphus fraxineus]|uniref:HMG box domain-containing protein n=1 Tax=Hymenoscyphus fraxineus TaxID=746836 RepID=A0A9N9KX43_9HELO|nr:hypothetical protein HYFRA_00010351 [Hymenoscyphus fraxineus]